LITAIAPLSASAQRALTPGRMGDRLPAPVPATTVRPTTVQAAASQLETPYTLGPGDQLRVDIFRLPQYSGETEVLVDGSLNLPLIGTISVEGMTLEQASASLSQAYSQFLRRPIITLNLLNRRPLQLGVAGEVNRPGSYTLTPQGTQFPTITQLLEAAGGITQSANLRQIQIRRPQRAGSEQTLSINLWQLLETGDSRYNITLRDGDTVFIPTAPANLAEASLLAAASFAADANQPINIAVVGEVYRPGPYTVQGGTARTGEAGTPGGAASAASLPTVTRAIQVAGGIKPLADIRRVQVRRPTRTGSEQTFEVNLWALLDTGDLRQDAILQEGDTIIVPTATNFDPAEASRTASASFSPDTIRVNVVGEVARGGVLELTPNSPLSQAVLAAGGFNNRARRGTVELVRLNTDGTVSRQRYPVDFAQGVDEANNPSLRNNDVVIVNRSGLASVGDALETILTPLGRVFSIFNFFRILE
jgi:polysaccharide biosynthesis/export protein